MSIEIHELAEHVQQAVSSLDVAAVERLYAEDFVIWHNFDNKTQTAFENLRFLEELFLQFKSLRYEGVKRELTETGYVQQHLLIGELKNGNRMEMPCCHVVQVEAGLIKRFDEYFDPAPLYAAINT